MPYNFVRVRTPEQITEEAEKLAKLIPSLDAVDARILAQATISLPVHDQDERLVRIVRLSIIRRTTDMHVREALRRWLHSSTKIRRQRRLQRLANAK